MGKRARRRGKQKQERITKEISKRFRVEVLRDATGRATLKVHSQFRMTDGDLAARPQEFEDPAFLIPSATVPRMKINAARYFLMRLRLGLRNEAACTIYIEAFIQALRAATFVLQKHGAGKPGFDDWYEQQRQALRADDLLRTVVDLRNLSEKEGVEFLHFDVCTIVRQSLDGRIRAEAGLPEISIADIQLANPVEGLSTALEKVAAVVEEAHLRGFIAFRERPNTNTLRVFRETAPDAWKPTDLNELQV